MVDPTKNWIRLHRNLLFNELWRKEPFTRGQAWVDLLLLANHSDGFINPRGIKITVKRGQVGYSIKQLAIRWKWSEGKVNRYLELLYDFEMITLEKHDKNGAQNGAQKNCVSTLITILNYDFYQYGEAENDIETERKRSANGAQTETNKEGKEGKEGKEEVKDMGDKSPPPSSLFNLWNKIVREPRATVMNKTREAKCRLRLKERKIDEWEKIFNQIKATPFLTGENDRGWKADFDWIISNDTNAVKVLEGKYDNPTHRHSQQGNIFSGAV